MVTYVTINGKPVNRKQARLSVFDNSLLYAEGLFETLLTIGPNPIFAKEHLQRLQTGADTIGLKLPVSLKTLSQWMHEASRKHPSKVNKLRLTVTSGESERWTGSKGKPQVIIIVAPHTLPVEPYRLYVSDLRVDQGSTLRQIKTISYALQAAALKQAKDRGFDDALLLNQKEQIAEITSANFFWVKKNRIFTPPVSAGCLRGVTRLQVLNQAKKLGFSVMERHIKLSELMDMDEWFLSSSLKLVLPIREIRCEKRSLRKDTGPVTTYLRTHFLSISGHTVR
jgi:branched-chain amino acid aminotransferase